MEAAVVALIFRLKYNPENVALAKLRLLLRERCDVDAERSARVFRTGFIVGFIRLDFHGLSGGLICCYFLLLSGGRMPRRNLKNVSARIVISHGA